MGLFDFSGSTSESSGSSSSFNTSESGSTAGGFSVAGSQDSIAFEDIFAQLFGGASGAASGLDPSMLTQAANTLFSSGTGFLDSIGGDAGSQYLEGRLSGDNGVLQEQIDLLGEDLGSFFNEQINPAITAQAVGGGALGGGRQGVAQGLAADAVGVQFRRGAAQLRSGDIASRDAAALGLAQNNVAGASAGLGGLGALGGIANMGFNAELAPYAQLAAILGDPTVLGSSGSASEDFANAFSSSFGTSQASHSSSGRSLGFGFGEVG